MGRGKRHIPYTILHYNLDDMTTEFFYVNLDGPNFAANIDRKSNNHYTFQPRPKNTR